MHLRLAVIEVSRWGGAQWPEHERGPDEPSTQGGDKEVTVLHQQRAAAALCQPDPSERAQSGPSIPLDGYHRLCQPLLTSLRGRRLARRAHDPEPAVAIAREARNCRDHAPDDWRSRRLQTRRADSLGCRFQTRVAPAPRAIMPGRQLEDRRPQPPHNKTGRLPCALY
jgi:hypothetical protein